MPLDLTKPIVGAAVADSEYEVIGYILRNIRHAGNPEVEVDLDGHIRFGLREKWVKNAPVVTKRYRNEYTVGYLVEVTTDGVVTYEFEPLSGGK